MTDVETVKGNTKPAGKPRRNARLSVADFSLNLLMQVDGSSTGQSAMIAEIDRFLSLVR